MRVYAEEIRAARSFAERELGAFPRLTDEQLKRIRVRAKQLLAWSHAHPLTHNALNVAVYGALLIADGFVLLALPTALPTAAATVVVGLLHGFLAYSFNIFSLHEGGAHRASFVGTGRVARLLAASASEASRIFFSDPEYYRENHAHHHTRLGSPDDGSFTIFVLPRRVLKSFVPFANFLPFNDYRVHTGMSMTPSRGRSIAIGMVYHGLYAVMMAMRFGWELPLLALGVVGVWVAFVLDRLRESTEHALMPLDPWNGTRDLGVGPWGLLLGGGPWGQPCHLAHHLAPSLSWYQQIRLHFFLRRLLSPAQRAAFCPSGARAAPRLMSHIWKTWRAYLPSATEDEAASTMPVN